MRPVHSAAAMVLLLLAALAASAQARNPLVGTWAVAEGTTLPSGAVRENPSGMMIFTGRHFSWIIFFGKRPNYTSPAEATDAQKVAVFETFGANAGTYTGSGSAVTLHYTAAKHPYMHAPGYTEVWNFKLDGKTLTMTSKQGGVRKLTRVE
jgi:Lipocalin-like domain